MKMTLDELLKPLKWMDTQVHRGYAHLNHKWEEKGRNRYSLAFLVSGGNLLYLGSSSIATKVLHPDMIPAVPHTWKDYVALTGASVFQMLLAHDGAYSGYKYFFRMTDNSNSEAAVDAFTYYSQKIQRGFRLPVVGFGLLSAYLCGETLWSGEMSEAYLLFNGMVWFGALGTSMYLKDDNPKVASKEFFLKRAGRWIKEYVTLPKPLTESVPVVNQ